MPGETVYVVRPGDTLWSIASRFDHGGDPRPLAEALAQETGSAIVVPGERIAIP
jgi:nucleoid-associated protein YgaU